MEKRISYSQFQSVKCVAKACDPLIVKRNKLHEKLQKLAQEYKDCDTQIQSLEAGIVSVIGLSVEQLVKKVVEPGVDVNGQPKKTTKYLPTAIVSYDEKHKQYVITIPDASEASTDNAVEGEPVNVEPASEENVEEVDTTDALADTETTTDVPTDAPIFE